MFKKFLLVGALVCSTASVAHAATVNDGDSICEDNNIASGVTCDQSIPELGQTFSQSLDLAFSGTGSAVLNGFVRGRDDELFADRAVFSGTGSYRFTLTLGEIVDDSNDDGAFDALITFSQNSADVGNAVLSGSGATYSLLANLSLGDLNFDLNAAGGAIANNSAAYYSVDVAAVPVPAAGLLLLTALGGAAALRRRRKAA